MNILSPTLNFNSQSAVDEFMEVIDKLPNDIEVYIVGGSVRNAIFREFFGEALTQRDYDQVATSNSSKYLEYLKSLGFYLGRLDRPTQKVYAYDLIPNPPEDSYVDSLVFDIHTMDGTTIEENLATSSGFTINGFALPIRKVFDNNWFNDIIQLPGALEDMKHKQLRVNKYGYKEQPANLFAGIRFMSKGFLPPSKEDVDLLLAEMPNITPERFEKGVKKVWNYVGGEEKARELVKQLNIDVDIFNRQEVLNKLK